MDKEIKYTTKKEITFGDVVELYRRVVYVGFPHLSLFGLSANNRQEGISLNVDVEYSDHFHIRQSDVLRGKNSLDISMAQLDRFDSDIGDLISGNIFVRHAIIARLDSEYKLTMDHIKGLPVDSMNAWKQPEVIPFTNRFLPFVSYKDIRATRKVDGGYDVRILADSDLEAELLKKRLEETLSQDQHEREKRPFPFTVNQLNIA